MYDKSVCPNCGLEMEGGYIYSSRQIKWANDANPRYLLMHDDETLVGDELVSTKCIKVKARKCINCKVVMFAYNALD